MEFTIGSALRVGWEAYKTRPWFFVGVSAIVIVSQLVVGTASAAIDVGGTLEDPSILGKVIALLLSALVTMCVTAFYLAAHASPETVALQALWHPRPYWKFVGVTLLLWPLTLVWDTAGFLFALLLPLAAAVWVWALFVHVIVIDQELGPIDAVKESIRLVRGHYWSLFGLVLAQGILVFAGVLALAVGILVTLPVVMLSTVHAYRVLLYRAGPRATQRAAVSS